MNNEQMFIWFGDEMSSSRVELIQVLSTGMKLQCRVEISMYTVLSGWMFHIKAYQFEEAIDCGGNSRPDEMSKVFQGVETNPFM